MNDKYIDHEIRIRFLEEMVLKRKERKKYRLSWSEWFLIISFSASLTAAHLVIHKALSNKSVESNKTEQIKA